MSGPKQHSSTADAMHHASLVDNCVHVQRLRLALGDLACFVVVQVVCNLCLVTLCDDALQAHGNGSTLSGLLSQAPNNLEAVRLWAAAQLNEIPSLPKFDLANFLTSFLKNLEGLPSKGIEQLVLHAATQYGH